MDPTKTKAITDWPIPQDIHELHSFIEPANYYHRYVENYAGICLPLFTLFTKDAPWEWTDEHLAAFNSLKHALTTAPVLQPFNPDAETVLVTDASKFALGATLLQMTDLGYSPVAFYSRNFINAARYYTTCEQELLSIQEALKTW